MSESNSVFEIVGRTDTGRMRSRNEDQFVVLEALGLCAVADGMGGHADGNIASDTAVSTIKELVDPANGVLPGEEIDRLVEFLREVIDEANRRIFLKNRGYFSLEGMGTTLVVLQMHDDSVITACVGDSRIYRFRKGKLKQLTQDHSLLEELKRFNILGSREAHFNINKNIITRALGMNETVVADLDRHPHKAGDLYLLCSDGLTDLVGDEQIGEILSGEGDLAAATEQLVQMANQNGGNDNITVILARRRD